MEKRTLIALALSFLVLGFYPVILQKFYPDYNKKSSHILSQSKIPSATPAAMAPVSEKTFLKSDVLASDDDLAFKNKKISLVFNKKDGGIREIGFPAFKDSETKLPIKFLSLEASGVSPGSLIILSDGDLSPVLGYEAAQYGNEISFISGAFSGKLKVEKKFILGPGYWGNVLLRFENSSDASIEFQYELLNGSGVKPRHSIDGQYIEADFFSVAADKKILKHIAPPGAGKQIASQHPVQWIAIKDRHFSVVVKPKSDGGFTGLVRGLGNHDFGASLVSPKITIPAHGMTTEEFVLYTGPNEVEPLKEAGLEDLVNFGKFDAIGKLLVGALELLQKVFKNYGIAIIALTTLINLALFPFTRVSYMAMKRMQLVQPQMNKLREQHKKNPDKLNKETMELYRKHKVNPFGGCLPMVVQIPIFIALYVALSKSVILINSQLLWIKDLSSPDRVYLPFTLPFLGNSIHVLPLLMVGAMFFQQKFTQVKIEGQDPAVAAQQKMMTVMMPVIFGFIFYQMPSGLVLYWLTNTILMSLYQLKLKNMTIA
jgi:YidC/Oxa1 family membrane protein insertase